MSFSLRKKLYLGFLSIIILFLVTVIVSTTQTQRIVRLSGDILASEQRLEVVQRLNLFARTANDNGAHYLLAPDYIESDFHSQFESSVQYVNDEISRLVQITPDPEGKQQIEKFRHLWTVYTADRIAIMEHKAEGKVQEAQEIYTKDSFDSIAFALHAFSKAEQAQIDNYRQDIETGGRTIRMVNYTMAALAVPLSLMIAFGLSNYLTRRIRLLKTSAQAVAQGNLQVPDLHFEGRDELTELADAFNGMTESLRSVMDSNQFLQQLSSRDGLTGIANRRNYDEFLEREWYRLALESRPLSMILFDIDYFKRFNDLYGHQAGDVCLKQVAAVLEEGASGLHDLAARYGGEEFVVLLPDQSRDEALAAAEQFRQAIERLHIPHEGSEVKGFVTVSIGISTLTATFAEQPGRLLIAADKALYEAKRNGRNRICIYEAE